MHILLRAHKSPFTPASADKTFALNLIGNNAGNLVFSQAAYRLLSTRNNQIDARNITALSPDYINAHYDMVVIPLANAFRRSFVKQLEQLTRLIEGLTIPAVIWGVGTQGAVKGRAASPDLDPAVTAFMRAALEHSASVGVRGEMTAQYLADLGFGDEVVDVIGCPSMFMYGPHLQIDKKVDELDTESKISLNVSPYRSMIGPISIAQAAKYPNLIYTAQDLSTLGLLLTGEYSPDLAPGEDAPTTLDHPLLRDNRTRFCLDPATWMDYLRGFDFSFGTRIHGNIIALLAGTPAVLLAHDLRTLELAEYHEIPYRLLTKKVDDFDATDLYASADWGPTMAGHQARWQRMRAFMEKNGLRHTYLPGESPRAFDERLAATTFPPPVERQSHEAWHRRAQRGIRAVSRRSHRGIAGLPRPATRFPVTS